MYQQPRHLIKGKKGENFRSTVKAGRKTPQYLYRKRGKEKKRREKKGQSDAPRQSE